MSTDKQRCDICDRISTCDVCSECGMLACPSCMTLDPICDGVQQVCVECKDDRDERIRDDYLSHSDDGEPITLEWVAEHFGDKYGRITIGPHRIFVRSTPGEVDINCHDEPLTRGQLRQLLAALGWRGEEETTDDR